MSTDNKKWFSFVVGFGILLPMFFTLSGGLYRNTEIIIDSGGVIATLPLPISILTCVIALVILFGRLPEAKAGWALVIGTVAVLLISLWLGSDGVTPHGRKLVMIAQVGLPLMGLILGQLMPGDGKPVALAYLTVLTLVIPLQLYFSPSNSPWDLSSFDLSVLRYEDFIADNLRLFTIYGHIQYVSLIFVCAYGFALSALWGKYKVWLVAVSILLIFYVLRSFSFLTTVAYSMLIVLFVVWQLSRLRVKVRLFFLAAVVFFVVLLGWDAYRVVAQQKNGLVINSASIAYQKFRPILDGKIPSNIQERFGDWELFGKRIIETPKTILVGHPEPMPREIRTSPHNWYIDIAHTFGLIGLLPILVLIGYTAHMCWRHRSSVSPQTWWLAGIVFYLVIVDSNFKVTLRQPYPGIVTFFMWGLLLSRLSAAAADKRGV